MPFAEINGARLFYTDEGAGPALVLVHGTTADSNDWNLQFPAFEHDFRVIAPDLRGHGLSSSPEGSYYSRHDAADLAQLAELLGITTAVVIGHSTGAQCAIALAVHRPQLVRGVVAIDPSYGADPAGREALRQRLGALTDSDVHDWFRQTFTGFYIESSPPYLRLWHARRLQGVLPWVLRACLRDRMVADDQFFFRPDTATMLARVACPVFTLRRTGSAALPPSADWDRSQCRNAYSVAMTWPGAGHWPHQERPDEFNAAVTSWMHGLPT